MLQLYCENLSDVGLRALAEGLKGNSSVMWVRVVSRGGLFVVVVSLTCVSRAEKIPTLITM